jgi:long-chain acyl-CoA synthetase
MTTETLAAVLDRAASLYGDSEAVSFGDLRWSYHELKNRTAGLDAALDQLELATGDVVAVMSRNSPEHLVCWMAVPRSGRILNDLNYRLAPAELKFILDDCGARVLIVDDTFLDVGRSLAAECESLEHLVHASRSPAEDLISFDALCTGAHNAGSPADIDSEAIAGIFYTGGTTGLPKGVMLTHGNLVQNAKHALISLGYHAGDAYLHSAPMFHLADGLSTYALTWAGGRHVIAPAFEPGEWLHTVAAERVTRTLLVPTMINMLINHPEINDHDLGSLVSLLYGASPIPTSLLRRAMECIPCQWHQVYGMTEAAPLVSHLTPTDHRDGLTGDERATRRLRSAGRPIIGVEVQIRRADGVTVCDANEQGEIYVRGPNIMQGYWNRPEETAQALVADGWYRSGDAAMRDEDGYLYIVDRVKDMIISGGENVYSTEVENALYEHEAVLECAVVGIPHDRWGEQVHAAIVLRERQTATEDELIEFCRPLIAGYKLPRSISFLDTLPKSGAGKVLKREVRALTDSQAHNAGSLR